MIAFDYKRLKRNGFYLHLLFPKKKKEQLNFNQGLSAKDVDSNNSKINNNKHDKFKFYINKINRIEARIKNAKNMKKEIIYSDKLYYDGPYDYSDSDDHNTYVVASAEVKIFDNNDKLVKTVYIRCKNNYYYDGVPLIFEFKYKLNSSYYDNTNTAFSSTLKKVNEKVLSFTHEELCYRTVKFKIEEKQRIANERKKSKLKKENEEKNLLNLLDD